MVRIEHITVHGAVICFCGDNPEGVGFLYRKLKAGNVSVVIRI